MNRNLFERIGTIYQIRILRISSFPALSKNNAFKFRNFGWKIIIVVRMICINIYSTNTYEHKRLN